MTNRTKLWLIIAVCLLMLGCIIFGAAMSKLGWDFTKLSTVKYETNTYEINEDFNNISIKTDTEDITFVLSNDGKCKVECYEESNAKHFARTVEDILNIGVDQEKKWYEHIGINFGSPKITVYLPKAQYSSLSVEESTGDIEVPKDFKFANVQILLDTGDVEFFASASESLKIITSTGDADIKNIVASAITLSTSTGDMTVNNVTCEGEVAIHVSTGKVNVIDTECKSVISSGSTGDILLKNVNAEEKFFIERDTGDVKFDGSDAAEIFIKTDTGDVTGSLLTDKVFITQTDTGSVNVPKTTSGGKCEIVTDTGDIKITINN